MSICSTAALYFVFLIVQFGNVNSQQQNPFQYLIEQTNYLIYNSSSIIEDTTAFFPSYDFIIVVSSVYMQFFRDVCHNDSF